MPPHVSVLMAVRDGERFLDAALASLAAQTFADFEIILVDNGSLDGTTGIIAEWEKRDPRLRALRHDRPGLSGSQLLRRQPRAPRCWRASMPMTSRCLIVWPCNMRR